MISTPVESLRKGLVKAYLEIEQPDLPDSKAFVPVRFNPTEYQIQKQNSFADINIPGLETPPIQFVRGSGEKLSTELLVDTSDTLADVREEYVDKLRGLMNINSELHAPPIVKLIWDQQVFRGVVESLNITYVMFRPDGVPIRAKSLSMKQYRPIKEQVRESPTFSPDFEKSYTTVRGDTLPGVAFKVYRDATVWREIATANDVRDPRRLAPGLTLLIPKIALRTTIVISNPSTTQSGLPSVEYYAPNYKVELEGAELDQETKGDVLQVKVTMEKDNLTGFNLTINNWDDRNLRFKYSDGDTFRLGRRIHIRMGYADWLVSMVRGQINSISPKFPQSGSPTLDVSGTDLLFCLKDSKPGDGDTLIHVDKADWQIAQEVAKRNNLPIEVTREGPEHPIVVQEKDKDDASFLLDRARRIDFDLYMKTDSKTEEDKLFFVKPTDGRDSQPIRVFKYEWGKTLISYSSKVSVEDQVTSVTVRGWNPRTKEKFEATADANDLPKTGGNGDNGPIAAARSIKRPEGKQEFIVDASVVSQDEAKELAISRLVERAYQYNQGSGQVIGQPELRPGDNVELTGLGTRISGRYRIRKVDHTLGGSGYQTQFDVETTADGG